MRIFKCDNCGAEFPITLAHWWSIRIFDKTYEYCCEACSRLGMGKILAEQK